MSVQTTLCWGIIMVSLSAKEQLLPSKSTRIVYQHVGLGEEISPMLVSLVLLKLVSWIRGLLSAVLFSKSRFYPFTLFTICSQKKLIMYYLYPHVYIPMY